MQNKVGSVGNCVSFDQDSKQTQSSQEFLVLWEWGKQNNGSYHSAVLVFTWKVEIQVCRWPNIYISQDESWSTHTFTALYG